MKNGINTGQFRVETGSRGNGRKNPSPISVNTETGPANTETNGQKWKTERVEMEIFPSVFNASHSSFDTWMNRMQSQVT
jgi:hypothetical protein